MRKAVVTFAALLSSAGAFAESLVAEKSFWSDPFNDPMLPIYLVTTLVFVVVLLVALVAIYLVRVLNMFTEQAAREKAQQLGVAYVPKPTWWDKLTQQLNDSVPVTEEKSIELNHAYDGIRELDNHLPPWWKWLFYATIGWSAVYVVVYHFSNTLPLSGEEYQIEIAMAEEQARQLKASQPRAAIDINTLAFSNDAAIIEHGKSVFNSNNCGSCHREDGGGNTIGPNLTDDYWLHGGDIKNLFTTIKDGVVEKGMPAWGKTMSEQDVRDVTFYVISLHGTNPPDAKAPQGELFKQEASAKADTTQAQAIVAIQ